MKKIAIFFMIVIIIVSTMAYLYWNQTVADRETQKENAKFNIEVGQEIVGQDLVTIINRVIDTNEKNKISKDSKGNYINNEKNSIQMDITFTDVDVTYNVEVISKAGMANFLENYRGIMFKCKKVQYHEATGKIQYINVEQITE